MLKPGTKIKIIDGLGCVLCEAVVEKTDNATVFVREWFPNGKNVTYSVPISAIDNGEINTKPDLEEVTSALRVCFALTMWDEVRRRKEDHEEPPFSASFRRTNRS